MAEWWGLIELGWGDHALASRIELGDRASGDLARENARHPGDREDWVVAKAMSARPALFVETLSFSAEYTAP